MALADWKDVAAIIGIIVAVLTYLTNSYFQFRNKRIENLKRYLDAQDKLFKADGFIMSVIKQLEDGTYERKLDDADMEKKINRFLGDVEHIALLTSHGAVPQTVQVYMFGWFAQKIHPHLTNGERENIFWELAVHYIGELKKAADDYVRLPNKWREKCLRKNSLQYKKYS